MINKKKSFAYKLSIVTLVIYFLIAVFYDYLPLKPYNEPSGMPLVGPCEEHILGTDDLGMDLFSQLLYGTRVSIFLSISCALISGIGGSIIGIVSGYYGGKIDTLILGTIEVFQSIPELPLMIVLGLL